MNRTILFPIFAAITLLVGTVGINAYAQNVTQNANQTGEKAQAAMNETGEAAGNVTKGLSGAANETGEAAGNVTKGLGKAVNETGEALSNVTGNVIEGIKDLFNGSSK